MRRIFLILLCALFAGCASTGGVNTSLEYAAKGEMYQKTGDYKKALKYLNKAVEKDEYNIDAYASRGALLFTLEDYQNALSDFNIVKHFNPNRSEAYSAAGAALAAMGGYVEAKENIDRALELSPSNVQAVATLGGIYYQTKNYKEAIEQYTNAIALLPAANLYFMRGVCYQQYGMKDEAAADYQTAGLTEGQYPQL
jgi:tetratricopeptide (TPR) repeat protein